MIAAVILLKLVINASVAISLCFKGRFDLALMFAGFGIADAGSAWVALR